MKGYITKGIGGFYYVKTPEGIVECKPRGIFRKQKITPVAGDEVTLETENGAAVIAEIAPRKNVFVRPPMANLDVLFLVASTTQPTPSTLVLDKLAAIAVDKGVFHPHAKLHHIKKENIGLIEVMGLAVLPSRLKKELFELADALVARTPVSQYPEELQKHAEWAEDILARHPELNGDTVHLILQDEVGHVFAQVLADAGVYKMDEAGRAGFVRFLASVQ